MSTALLLQRHGPCRHHKPGSPAGRAASGGRANRLNGDTAARDHPRDHRVRVPHFARPKLIATPYGGWNLCNEVKHAPCARLVFTQSHRAFNSLGDIRNVAVVPETDLVSEDPESPGPTTANCAFGYNATIVAAEVRDGRLLDDESLASYVELKGRVI